MRRCRSGGRGENGTNGSRGNRKWATRCYGHTTSTFDFFFIEGKYLLAFLRSSACASPLVTFIIIFWGTGKNGYLFPPLSHCEMLLCRTSVVILLMRLKPPRKVARKLIKPEETDSTFIRVESVLFRFSQVLYHHQTVRHAHLISIPVGDKPMKKNERKVHGHLREPAVQESG